MKILYVVTSADGGGAQKYVLQLARHFEGEIAAGTGHENLPRQARGYGIPFHPLPHLKRKINPYYDIRAWREMVVLLRRLRPDIVHVNSSKAGFLGSLAGRSCGIPVVFTAHGFIFNQPRGRMATGFFSLLERYASKFRDFTIAVSESDRAAAVRQSICPPDRITTIHNGLPPLSFVARATARSQLGIPEQSHAIGTIANLYHRKGLDVLLHALARLKPERRRRIHSVIIGEGPQRQLLERLIQQLGLDQTVHLAGAVPHAQTLLKAFDTFVLPSRREGFPYALLEAGQAGLPVIATAVGGNAEAVGLTGKLIPAGDVQALADALEAALDMRAPASPIPGRFTESAMLEQTMAIYKKLLHR